MEPQLLDGLERAPTTRGRCARHDRRGKAGERVARETMGLRLQRGVADRIGEAERIEAGRKMPEAANRFRQVERGDCRHEIGRLHFAVRGPRRAFDFR